jgi:PAS domain S-box-containing protein
MDDPLTTTIVRELTQLDLKNDKKLQESLLYAIQITKASGACIYFAANGIITIDLSTGLPEVNAVNIISFYNNAEPSEEILIIEDTHSNQHFSEIKRTIVTEIPRFYAAAPLVTKQGVRIGALCLMDQNPHPAGQENELNLKILSQYIISMLETKLNLSTFQKSFSALTRAREEAISNEIKLRALFESLTDVYVFLDMSGQILDFNQAAYDYILKFQGKKMIRGSYTANYLNHVDNAAYIALNGKRVSQEMLSYADVNERVWWDSIFEPVRNKNGAMMGVSFIARNINNRKMDSEKILKQNAILKTIAHIHSHEYRGPVSAILGLMNLIEADQQTMSEEYLVMLRKAVNQLDEKTYTVINLISDLNQL